MTSTLAPPQPRQRSRRASSVITAERIFWPATVFLLAILLTAQGVSIRQESQTYDEAVHLASGYSYLTTGDYRLNPEHPSLSKMLSAVPLLFVIAWFLTRRA